MAIYGFDEAGARRISEFVRQSERTPRVGRRLRRQPPVLGGTSSPSGVDLSPCGCGSCVDSASMTVNAADFGGVWDAACEYVVTINGTDIILVYQGSGVWESASFAPDGHTFTMTVTSQEPNGVTLERKTSGDSLWGRWINTVTFWKTHCDMTLFLTSATTDDGALRPGCSICIKPRRSAKCGDCIGGQPMTIDKADFGGTTNGSCSYVINYEGDDRELTYIGSGVWESAAFGGSDHSLRLTVTSPAAGDVLVELFSDMGILIGSFTNTSTWTPSCPITLLRISGDVECSICLSLDEELVETCAGA